MDCSETRNEAVSRTDRGGMATSLLRCIGVPEAGTVGLSCAGLQHRALDTEYGLERIFPRLEHLCAYEAGVFVAQRECLSQSALPLLATAAERGGLAGRG
jgi:hypothetical protein